MTYSQELLLFLSKFWIVPICAILWRIGGKGGFPGARYFRKIGVPLSIVLYSLVLQTGWMAFLVLPAFFGVSSLPNTLKGSSIWNAWWWLPIKGFLYGLTLYPIHFNMILLALGISVIFTIAFTIVWIVSNLDSTENEVPHHELEWFVGGMYGYIAFIYV